MVFSVFRLLGMVLVGMLVLNWAKTTYVALEWVGWVVVTLLHGLWVGSVLFSYVFLQTSCRHGRMQDQQLLTFLRLQKFEA
jgi:hypothetical protein